MELRHLNIKLDINEANVLIRALGGYAAITETAKEIKMFQTLCPPHINRNFEYSLIRKLQGAINSEPEQEEAKTWEISKDAHYIKLITTYKHFIVTKNFYSFWGKEDSTEDLWVFDSKLKADLKVASLLKGNW